MMKKTLKMLSILGAASFVGAGYASADAVCPNALFTARGCETQRISIGGFVTANYQWVDTSDDLTGPTDLGFGQHIDPNEFNNFYMKNIRLFVRAELCETWTAFMSIDFAGKDSTQYDYSRDRTLSGSQKILSSDQCRDRLPIFVDRAYIQKQWCNSTFRAGYQKVNFGAEEVIPDEYLKTIDRSIATNFFMHLGRRAVAFQYIPGARNINFGGNDFADRHVGIFLSGDVCNNFHYNLAIVNGYSGLCRNSTQFNNELGYFAGIGYETCACNVDWLFGLNAGYKPQGGNWTADSFRNPLPPAQCIGGTDSDASVWAINPYVLANWNCLSILAEFLYGSVQNAQLTNNKACANPYGFNFIPSYMLNDCWELVGRLSYLNTNKMGTSIHNAFGAAPDSGNVRGADCKSDSFVASEVQFEKATALYLGVNYYTVNQAVKATLGYEWARFKNPFFGPIAGSDTPIGSFVNQKAVVQAVRAQLQLLF